MLSDTREVILALGGLKAVMDLTGRKYDAAWHWTKQDATFPANTFLIMTTALRERGLEARPSLWNQVERIDA